MQKNLKLFFVHYLQKQFHPFNPPNVIKLAAKEEAAEGHRIPKEIQKGTYQKKEAAKADGGSSVRKGI